jgi:hypothetical protein
MQNLWIDMQMVKIKQAELRKWAARICGDQSLRRRQWRNCHSKKRYSMD